MMVPASVASRPIPTIVITSAFLGRPAAQRISKASSDNASFPAITQATAIAMNARFASKP
jgi:hypothetical protein